jgi:hypothetical protein
MSSAIHSGHALKVDPDPVIITPSVAGYDAWYDASYPESVTYKADGIHVDQWLDKSGNGYHATASGNIPHVRSRLADRFVMQIDATENFGSSAPWGGGDGNSTAFFVGVLKVPTSYRTLLYGNASGAYQWVFDVTTLQLYQSNIGLYAGKGNGGVTAAVPFIAAVRMSTTVGCTQYIKNRAGAVTQETDSNSGAVGNVTLVIGGGGGYNWLGQICEVITYPTTLSDAEALSVISGLSGKWDI